MIDKVKRLYQKTAMVKALYQQKEKGDMMKENYDDLKTTAAYLKVSLSYAVMKGDYTDIIRFYNRLSGLFEAIDIFAQYTKDKEIHEFCEDMSNCLKDNAKAYNEAYTDRKHII